MPLSKARNRERMRRLRAVQPNTPIVQPNSLRHIPMVDDPVAIALNGKFPNCPDGRYRG